MGNLLNWKHQPKELRVIYLEDKKSGYVYPVSWPESFPEFIMALHEIFPTTSTLKSTKFLFKDASEVQVCVCSQRTFDALVPKHRQIAPTVDMYYVSLEKWCV
jgi:hypothetical protein